MKKNRPTLRPITLIGAALAIAASLHAQQQPILYGSPIPLEKAKQVAAIAVAEAQKNGWPIAVTIVDTAGDLVFFEKMDGTQLGSIQVSQDKARSAVLYKRPTKAYEDALAAGGIGLRVLKLPGAMPVEGGIPLIENGKIIGAIGVSGGQSSQDGQCATVAATTIH
jgi:glc operon protein GlcG